MASTALPIRVITIMTLCACRAIQCLRMAITARRAAMIDTPSAFIGNARMRTIILCKPVIRGVALRTIQTKHACMEGRVAVTA